LLGTNPPFRRSQATVFHLILPESGFASRRALRKECPRMSGKKRIPTDGGQSFGHNPFAGLSSAGLPPATEDRSDVTDGPPTAASPAPRKNRGRVDILRQTAHRGGKTVTVVTGFIGIGLPEKEKLAKDMQRACGTGGTVKEGRIEIQGDKRTEVARILSEAGFRPVFAGG
jgi:translation initiation factor 1